MTGVADIMQCRFDIGVVGGPLVRFGRITSGIIDETKTCPYEGMNVNFSGYMHRNSMQMDAVAVDVRRMFIRKELLSVVQKVIDNSEYKEVFDHKLVVEKNGLIDVAKSVNRGSDDYSIQNISYEICAAVALEGYRIMYDPNLEELL